jgi:hypothetical protein
MTASIAPGLKFPFATRNSRADEAGSVSLTNFPEFVQSNAEEVECSLPWKFVLAAPETHAAIAQFAEILGAGCGSRMESKRQKIHSSLGGTDSTFLGVYLITGTTPSRVGYHPRRVTKN